MRTYGLTILLPVLTRSARGEGVLAILDRLDNVIQTSPDQYRSRCPAHVGRSRSLSIKLVDDRFLLHCFAGCTAQEVVESVGLKLSDLFDQTTPYSAAIARKHQINTNARCFEIQDNGVLSSDELQSFRRASVTVEKALDTATTAGVINVP
jgi:hypothetical protein